MREEDILLFQYKTQKIKVKLLEIQNDLHKQEDDLQKQADDLQKQAEDLYKLILEYRHGRILLCLYQVL